MEPTTTTGSARPGGPDAGRQGRSAQTPEPATLGALADIARRARDATATDFSAPVTSEVAAGGPPPTRTDRPVSTSRGQPRVQPAPAATAARPTAPDRATLTGQETSGSDRRDHRLVVSVLVLAALVLVATVALAITTETQHGGVPTLLASGGRTSSGPGPAPTTPSTRPEHTRRGVAPGKHTKATSVVGSSTPVLSALSPATGSAGQAVTVSGSNFLSANGQIVARFGGETTSTNCPDQATCTVTVPDLSGAPRSVKVTITTEAGTSNTLTFHED